MKYHIDSEYVIKSREGTNRPIGRSMAYKILRRTAAEFGLKEIGTHTLRKTFGNDQMKKTIISKFRTGKPLVSAWRTALINLLKSKEKKANA